MMQHINMLGLRVEDRVTGLKGIVTSVAFDLYGCIQALVHPGLDKDGNVSDTRWFDIPRLVVTNDIPVMKRPDWNNKVIAAGEKGPAEKPEGIAK